MILQRREWGSLNDDLQSHKELMIDLQNSHVHLLAQQTDTILKGQK